MPSPKNQSFAFEFIELFKKFTEELLFKLTESTDANDAIGVEIVLIL